MKHCKECGELIDFQAIGMLDEDLCTFCDAVSEVRAVREADEELERTKPYRLFKEIEDINERLIELSHETKNTEFSYTSDRLYQSGAMLYAVLGSMIRNGHIKAK